MPVSPRADRPPGSVGDPNSRATGADLGVPRSSETPGVNNGRSTGVQGSLSFDRLDADSDGRISLAEYTQLTVQGSSSVASRSNASGTTDSTTSGSPGSTSSGSSGSVNSQSGAANGMSGGSQGGQYTLGQFRQLDRNNDGYISRNELNAAQDTSSDQIKQ